MTLSAVELKFLQGLLINGCDRAPGSSAEHFSKEYNIGTRIGRKFIYSDSDIERATALLNALNLPLEGFEKPTDRAGSWTRSGISEKSGTISPHSNSVAFRTFIKNKPLSSPGYQVGEKHEVGALDPELIVVVENFETFRQLERYGWVMDRLKECSNSLVLFKGDTIYRGDDSKRCLEMFNCRVWGFHDFDPAGLYMSASIPNVTEHLVPSESTLQSVVKKMKRSDLYYDQISSVLDNCTHVQIARLWTLMKHLQMGLPQEWMRDL